MAELFALIDNDDVQMVSQWGALERQPDFMQIENEITCALQVLEHTRMAGERPKATVFGLHLFPYFLWAISSNIYTWDTSQLESIYEAALYTIGILCVNGMIGRSHRFDSPPF